MGAIAPGLPLGGMLIVDEAIGATGAARAYGGGGLARASAEVVDALARAATADGTAHRVGRVATTDSYYRGQGRPLFGDEAGPAAATDPVALFAAAGALGCDMETETVLTVGRALGLRVGAILAVHGDRVGDRWLEDYEPAQAAVVRIAIAAALTLSETESTKKGDPQ
jgi:uridine phosphorylase